MNVTIENPPGLEDYNNPESNLKNPEIFANLGIVKSIGSVGLGHPEIVEIDENFVISDYLKGHSNTFNEVSEATHDSYEHHFPAYELRRMPLGKFVEVLVGSGVLSQDLVGSGILNRFTPDRLVISENVEQYRGGFRHIFLGDIGGGLHDLDTLEDAGLAGHGTDTRMVEPTSRGDRLRNRIGVPFENNPDLRTGTGMDIDNDGDTDLVRLRHLDAKSQFPEHWTTDQVIRAIVAIADTKGEQIQDGRTVKHTSTFLDIINGEEVEFTITVLTDHETGLIETSYVGWDDSKRAQQVQSLAA